MMKSTKDKDKVRKWAIKENRKVLWKDEKGFWHAATNRFNTPHYAVETEDILTAEDFQSIHEARISYGGY